MVDVSADTVLATGGSTAQTLSIRFAKALTPYDFGAAGDGTTDDTAAISAWLAHCGATNGVGDLSSGTYLISNLITLPNDPLFIFGKGPLSTIKCISNGGLTYSTLGTAENLFLKDFVFQCSGSQPGLSLSYVYQSVSGPNISLDGVQFNGLGCTASSLCSMSGLQQSILSRCIFRDSGGETTSSLDLTNGTINVGISDCQFIGPLSGATRAISVDAGSVPQGTQGIRIENTLIIAYATGVYISGNIDWVTLCNNMLDQNGQCVVVDASSSHLSGTIVISNNYFGGNPAFDGNGLIEAEYAAAMIIDGNTFSTNSGGTAIWFTNECNNVLVINNTGLTDSNVANRGALNGYIFSNNIGFIYGAAPIAVGASPFTFNAPTRGNVIVDGGTVSSIEIGRNTFVYATGMTTGCIPLGLNDKLIITFSEFPTMTFLPSE